MKNIYDDSGNNNEPDYKDNLAFPPSMPRCDIERLRKALKETKRSILDMQNKIMIDNGAYGEIHPLYKMANQGICKSKLSKL